MEHDNMHKIINFKDLAINKEKLKEEIQMFGKNVELFKN